ncbi:PAS domain-containing sensor histidine kinase [Halonotius sp. GCM10025705]|uniref:PAS domain-containing sensor histidine kinase n=1 Tax=Halonotius sp. GCM10025705 TaxID=3252678 RepID=UPI00360E64B6
MSELENKTIRGGNVLNRVSDAVVGVNSDFEYTFANTQAEQLLDTDEDSLLGETIWEAFPETADTIAETNIRNALETGQEQSYERYNDTLDRWFELRIFPDNEGLSIFFTDISERKEREAELERYEELIKTLPVAAGMNRPGKEGKFEFVNQAAVDLFDAESKAELKEYSPADMYANEDERKQFSERLREEGTIDQYEVQLTTLEGDLFWASITAKIAEIDGEVYIIGIIEDISVRKANEQELETQNERLEEFVNVLSHDLRNPLEIAQGRTAILEEETEDQYQEHIRPLGDALDRMEQIISDSLTLARQGDTVGEKNPASLVELVGKCWATVKTDSASLEVDDDVTLLADSDRLRHVFENLFRNAIDYGGDDVTIHVGCTEDGRLYVEDDGPGIPPDKRETVLKAGHTSSTGGTGFGLTIVKRIAEAHGWKMSITESRAGGARFEFDSVTLKNT